MPITQTSHPFSPYSFGLDRVVGRKVRYVDSTAANASNSNLGDSWHRPLATLEGAFSGSYAAAETTAGTVVYVAPGHTESITAAAGLDADIAGVSIVGLGNGRNRPTITISTATTADIDIDAANISIENMNFVCAIESMVAGIDVNADDFTLKNCDFYDSSATGLIWIDIGGGANGADRARVLNNRIWGTTGTSNWDSAIKLAAVNDAVEIMDNYIVGDYDDACVHNPTGTVLTNLRVVGNYLENAQAGQHAMELVSACTGSCRNNHFVTDAIATAADLGSLKAINNMFFDLSNTDAAGVAYPQVLTDGSTNETIQKVTKTVTFTAAAYEINTAVAVFTVTGQVKARAYGIVTTAVEADAGADGAISLGIGAAEVDTLAAVVVCNETNMAAGHVWATATTTKNGDVINNSGNWVIIGNGVDIQINVTVEDITAGVVDLYVEWVPISAGATVVAV